jgi:hypothetical protein
MIMMSENTFTSSFRLVPRGVARMNHPGFYYIRHRNPQIQEPRAGQWDVHGGNRVDVKTLRVLFISFSRTLNTKLSPLLLAQRRQSILGRWMVLASEDISSVETG